MMKFGAKKVKADTVMLYIECVIWTPEYLCQFTHGASSDMPDTFHSNKYSRGVLKLGPRK